jgi:hypothetical protein
MGKPEGGLIMKLYRLLSAFVLTGLLSGAAMAAQAQTRIMVQFGTPVAAVVANYMSPSPGPGYMWVNGYYSGTQWMPGQWVYRTDFRYQRQDRYGDRNARFNSRYANYGSYSRNDGNANFGRGNYGRNENRNYGRNNRRNDNRQNGRNSYRNGRGGRH